MAEEFISFDKVLRELQMQEEELKKLVSEGEIRAFRDQDKMKFKKEDVERFRKGRAVSKDDTLSQEDVPEELVFDEDDANQEVGMATAAISDDSFLEEEPPKLAPAPKVTVSRTTRVTSTASGRKPRGTSVELDEDQDEGALWKIVIIAGSLVLAIGLLVAMDATKGTPSLGITKTMAGWFKDKPAG